MYCCPSEDLLCNVLWETVLNMENEPWEADIALWNVTILHWIVFENALAELQVMQMDSVNVLTL